MDKTITVSVQTLKRLPLYLTYLENEVRQGKKYISAPEIAKDMKLTEILVKKDISYVTKVNGKPRIGHEITNLIKDIKTFLGYNDYSSAILVGTGKLGSALLAYNGFKEQSVEIVVAFDSNPNIIGNSINNIKIMNVDKLEDLCERMKIHIGIITTNSESAQNICDRLVKSGVKAIWNFAPIKLIVPENVIIQNENLASSLAVLSHKISIQNK